MARFNPTLPFDTVHGDDRGRAYFQGGVYFTTKHEEWTGEPDPETDADGNEIVALPTPAPKKKKVAASPPVSPPETPPVDIPPQDNGETDALDPETQLALQMANS